MERKHMMFFWPRFKSGTQVEVGDKFMSPDGEVVNVSTILFGDGFFMLSDGDGNDVYFGIDERVPDVVLAADEEPIKFGQTVWHAETGEELFVSTFVGNLVNVSDKKGGGLQLLPSQLTHTKPEIDTWERIEEDKGLNPFDYCKKVGHKLWTFDNAEEFKASDLVRRAKALAGVE